MHVGKISLIISMMLIASCSHSVKQHIPIKNEVIQAQFDACPVYSTNNKLNDNTQSVSSGLKKEITTLKDARCAALEMNTFYYGVDGKQDYSSDENWRAKLDFESLGYKATLIEVDHTFKSSWFVRFWDYFFMPDHFPELMILSKDSNPYDVTVLFMGTNSTSDWYINTFKNGLTYQDVFKESEGRKYYYFPRGRGGFRVGPFNMQNHDVRTEIFNHVKRKHGIDANLENKKINLRIVGHSQGAAVALQALTYLDGVKRKISGQYNINSEEIYKDPHLEVQSVFLFALPPTLALDIKNEQAQYLLQKYQGKIINLSCSDDIITQIKFAIRGKIGNLFQNKAEKCSHEKGLGNKHRMPRYIKTIDQYLSDLGGL